MSDDEGERYVYSDDEGDYGIEDEDDGAGSSAAAGGGGHARSAALSVPACGYRLLREDEIQGVQKGVVDEVAALLGLPPECAKTLLIHFKWNRDAVFDRFYADPPGVKSLVGISHLGESKRPSAGFECTICLDDFPASEGFALGCGHVFCRTCWSGFLSAAVTNNGANCIYAKCPADKCGEAVTSSVVGAMAPPDVAARWSLFETKHFVSVSKNMALCPAQGCSNAFVAPSGGVKTAVCSCGSKFCFKCSKEAHQPATCVEVDTWAEKCGNESETANWILANTKRCPKCAARIEKNQGCNHMKCTNKGCRHEFCWVCQGPWTEHGQSTGGYYACNKFKGKAPPAEGATDASRAKAELERYLFYYTRYSNHDSAGKFAAKHRATTQKRMADLAAMGGAAGGGGGGWEDVGFLESATEALLECRRVLKYTYVLGFYMSDGGEKSLFEHLQEQLERATEHLAELTEAPLEKVDRGDVLNYTRVTMQFLRHLLEGVEEGLTS